MSAAIWLESAAIRALSLPTDWAEELVLVVEELEVEARLESALLDVEVSDVEAVEDVAVLAVVVP